MLQTLATALPTWPTFSEEEINVVTGILRSGKVNYWTGEHGRNFEQEYAKAVGTPYAIALMNGTVALEAALFALDIGPGDEVVTTSRTFIASSSVIILRGARPVFADVDPDSQNITAESIERVLTPRTKAILVVHLGGWPCEMDAILTLAKKNKLYVIEDCAQAHGASFNQHAVGSFGDVAAFSFCQDKIITTGGEGGLITTSNEELYKKIWAYKDHGKSYDAVYHRTHPPGFRWLHETFGTNWRMTEMQAAIGRIQLKKLADWRRTRQSYANMLHQALSSLPAIRSPQPSAAIEHACYRYYAFVNPEQLKSNWNRDKIMQSLSARGVPCFTGSCSEIYQEKAFINAKLNPTTRLPIAKCLGESSLAFLVHPTLTPDHMKNITEIICEVINEASEK